MITKIKILYLLRKHGHSVAIAENGSKALEVLKDAAFDIILMDIEMPVMDGFDAARLIREGRAGKRHSAIPIIAVTAHILDDINEQIEKAGMDGYLAKPIDINKLNSILLKYNSISKTVTG